MDDFRGSKFIVGSDLRIDEQRRAANEFFRNQNENQRIAAENNRNSSASDALAIAKTHSKSNFLTQIGLFTAVLLTVIILAVIAILAYQKATDNQSLVDLNNIRDLKLSTLEVYNNAKIQDLTVSDDLTVSGKLDISGGLSINDGLSVGGITQLYKDLIVYEGVSIKGGLSVNGITTFKEIVFMNDDLIISTGGVSISEGLSVNGITNLYNDLIGYGGVSINGGLSVNSTSKFYDDVIAYQGVSIKGGLSVNGITTFKEIVFMNDDLIISTGGVSISEGLSVNGVTNLYNDLIGYGGVSINGGLSVYNSANFYNSTRIQETDVKVISDEDVNGGMTGLSTTGFQLNPEDSGKIFFVNHNRASTPANNIFHLPEAKEGLNYKFIWSTGISGGDGKTFRLKSTGSFGFNKLQGLINLNVLGNSGKIYSINAGDNPATLTTSKNLGLSGSIFEGSRIDCYSNGLDWYIQGDIGISPFDSSPAFTDYSGVSGHQGGVNSNFSFFA